MPSLRRRPVIALIVAALIWTVLSYAFISMFSGLRVCAMVNTHQTRPLSQAEMDAITEGCNGPNSLTLVITFAGYVAIAVAALLVAIDERRSDKPEVSAAP